MPREYEVLDKYLVASIKERGFDNAFYSTIVNIAGALKDKIKSIPEKKLDQIYSLYISGDIKLPENRTRHLQDLGFYDLKEEDGKDEFVYALKALEDKRVPDRIYNKVVDNNGKLLLPIGLDKDSMQNRYKDTLYNLIEREYQDDAVTPKIKQREREYSNAVDNLTDEEKREFGLNILSPAKLKDLVRLLAQKTDA